MTKKTNNDKNNHQLKDVKKYSISNLKIHT